jgi:CRP-like cAMP-binding protein
VITQWQVICVTDGNAPTLAPVCSTMFTRKRNIHPAVLASDMGATVPASELETLQRLATTIQVPAGEEIMRQGGFGRECFVVIDGRFVVERGNAKIIVGPGSVIGELALLALEPRTATVTATTDSSVYVLTRAEFATILDTCPNLARYVLEGAERRTAAA